MNRKKILLVDDSATVLLMERMILSKEPYDLVTAKDGEDALTKARAERPDLILLDLVMPKLDGLAVLRALREEPDTQKTPVIMVTTKGEAINVEAGYANGCNDYLTKPIDGYELITKIRSQLGQTSLRGQG